MVQSSEQPKPKPKTGERQSMAGWKLVPAVVITTILGAAVGAWSQYPEENGFELTQMAIFFGGLVGLVLSSFFGPKINLKSLVVAWIFTVITAVITGQPFYENRFYRADTVAWACSLVFGVACLVSAIIINPDAF
jgi:predicted branched-subunit amino acid permease